MRFKILKNKYMKIFCLSTDPSQFSLFKKLKYTPVGLGNEKFHNKWLRDNTLDNISYKNRFYSEFTFHYWFWKNLMKKLSNNEWIGFCAYRRFWANNNRLDSFSIEKKINIKNFQDYALKKNNKIWDNYDSILGEPVILPNHIKFLKIIKNGGLSPIINNFNNFINKKMNIKFHFDIFHGAGNIEKAIKLLEKKEQNDFYNFIINENKFNRGCMFICKSKKLINKFYSSLFNWLEQCENLFGYDKKDYNSRIYAFLGERYISYWFKKYSKYIEWPIFFFDTKKYGL